MLDWKPISKNKKAIQALKIDSPTNLSLVQISLKNKDFWDSLPIIENHELVKIKDEL